MIHRAPRLTPISRTSTSGAGSTDRASDIFPHPLIFRRRPVYKFGTTATKGLPCTPPSAASAAPRRSPCSSGGLALPASAEDVRVVATIKPVHSIVSAVMAGVGEPHLIMRGAASPHDFSLRPSDAGRLQDAHVVFPRRPRPRDLSRRPDRHAGGGRPGGPARGCARPGAQAAAGRRPFRGARPRGP